MNKKAFTLAEMFIVFTIIGILATIALTTVTRPWEIAYKYAYNKIYNALGVSIFNYMASSNVNSDTNSTFPQTSEDFCNALSSYMNTSFNKSNRSTRCNKGLDIIGNYPDDPNSTEVTKFTETETINGKNVSKYAQLILSNGMKIWIGAKIDENNSNKHTYFTYTERKKIGENEYKDFDTVNYYIVYIDINGNRKPNTYDYKQGRLPDIVAFAVTDRFTVVPLGYPIIDKKYISAYITYPGSDDGDTDEYSEIASDPMTYFEAKVNTYGSSIKSNDGKSWKLNADNRILTEYSVHSYNFEGNVFNKNSSFRIDNPALYTNFSPVFDSEKCGAGKELGDPNLFDTNCDIKIYDYS